VGAARGGFSLNYLANVPEVIDLALPPVAAGRTTCSSAWRPSTSRVSSSIASAWSRRQFQGPRSRPRAGSHGGAQHHRRPRLGRGALRHHPRVGPEHPGDRASDRQYALPGHGDMAYRVAAAGHVRLPTLRCAARRDAHPAAPRALLREAGEDAGRAAPETLGLSAIRAATGIIAGQLLRGQTNFATSIWKFNRVYSVKRQLADHARPVTYTMTPPKPALTTKPRPDQLYVHMPVKREGGGACRDGSGWLELASSSHWRRTG
jgi:hypothetical protein